MGQRKKQAKKRACKGKAITRKKAKTAAQKLPATTNVPGRRLRARQPSKDVLVKQEAVDTEEDGPPDDAEAGPSSQLERSPDETSQEVRSEASPSEETPHHVHSSPSNNVTQHNTTQDSVEGFLKMEKVEDDEVDFPHGVSNPSPLTCRSLLTAAHSSNQKLNPTSSLVCDASPCSVIVSGLELCPGSEECHIKQEPVSDVYEANSNDLTSAPTSLTGINAESHGFHVVAASSTTGVVEDVAETQNSRISASEAVPGSSSDFIHDRPLLKITLKPGLNERTVMCGGGSPTQDQVPDVNSGLSKKLLRQSKFLTKCIHSQTKTKKVAPEARRRRRTNSAKTDDLSSTCDIPDDRTSSPQCNLNVTGPDAKHSQSPAVTVAVHSTPTNSSPENLFEALSPIDGITSDSFHSPPRNALGEHIAPETQVSSPVIGTCRYVDNDVCDRTQDVPVSSFSHCLPAGHAAVRSGSGGVASCEQSSVQPVQSSSANTVSDSHPDLESSSILHIPIITSADLQEEENVQTPSKLSAKPRGDARMVVKIRRTPQKKQDARRISSPHCQSKCDGNRSVVSVSKDELKSRRRVVHKLSPGNAKEAVQMFERQSYSSSQHKVSVDVSHIAEVVRRQSVILALQDIRLQGENWQMIKLCPAHLHSGGDHFSSCQQCQKCAPQQRSSKHHKDHPSKSLRQTTKPRKSIKSTKVKSREFIDEMSDSSDSDVPLRRVFDRQQDVQRQNLLSRESGAESETSAGQLATEKVTGVKRCERRVSSSQPDVPNISKSQKLHSRKRLVSTSGSDSDVPVGRVCDGQQEVHRQRRLSRASDIESDTSAARLAAQKVGVACMKMTGVERRQHRVSSSESKVNSIASSCPSRQDQRVEAVSRESQKHNRKRLVSTSGSERSSNISSRHLPKQDDPDAISDCKSRNVIRRKRLVSESRSDISECPPENIQGDISESVKQPERQVVRKPSSERNVEKRSSVTGESGSHKNEKTVNTSSSKRKVEVVHEPKSPDRKVEIRLSGQLEPKTQDKQERPEVGSKHSSESDRPKSKEKEHSSRISKHREPDVKKPKLDASGHSKQKGTVSRHVSDEKSSGKHHKHKHSGHHKMDHHHSSGKHKGGDHHRTGGHSQTDKVKHNNKSSKNVFDIAEKLFTLPPPKTKMSKIKNNSKSKQSSKTVLDAAAPQAQSNSFTAESKTSSPPAQQKSHAKSAGENEGKQVPPAPTTPVGYMESPSEIYLNEMKSLSSRSFEEQLKKINEDLWSPQRLPMPPPGSSQHTQLKTTMAKNSSLPKLELETTDSRDPRLKISRAVDDQVRPAKQSSKQNGTKRSVSAASKCSGKVRGGMTVEQLPADSQLIASSVPDIRNTSYGALSHSYQDSSITSQPADLASNPRCQQASYNFGNEWRSGDDHSSDVPQIQLSDQDTHIRAPHSGTVCQTERQQTAVSYIPTPLSPHLQGECEFSDDGDDNCVDSGTGDYDACEVEETSDGGFDEMVDKVDGDETGEKLDDDDESDNGGSPGSDNQDGRAIFRGTIRTCPIVEQYLREIRETTSSSPDTRRVISSTQSADDNGESSATDIVSSRMFPNDSVPVEKLRSSAFMPAGATDSDLYQVGEEITSDVGTEERSQQLSRSFQSRNVPSSAVDSDLLALDSSTQLNTSSASPMAKENDSDQEGSLGFSPAKISHEHLTVTETGAALEPPTCITSRRVVSSQSSVEQSKPAQDVRQVAMKQDFTQLHAHSMVAPDSRNIIVCSSEQAVSESVDSSLESVTDPLQAGSGSRKRRWSQPSKLASVRSQEKKVRLHRGTSSQLSKSDTTLEETASVSAQTSVPVTRTVQSNQTEFPQSAYGVAPTRKVVATSAAPHNSRESGANLSVRQTVAGNFRQVAIHGSAPKEDSLKTNLHQHPPVRTFKVVESRQSGEDTRNDKSAPRERCVTSGDLHSQPRVTSVISPAVPTQPPASAESTLKLDIDQVYWGIKPFPEMTEEEKALISEKLSSPQVEPSTPNSRIRNADGMIASQRGEDALSNDFESDDGNGPMAYQAGDPTEEIDGDVELYAPSDDSLLGDEEEKNATQKKPYVSPQGSPEKRDVQTPGMKPGVFSPVIMRASDQNLKSLERESQSSLGQSSDLRLSLLSERQPVCSSSGSLPRSPVIWQKEGSQGKPLGSQGSRPRSVGSHKLRPKSLECPEQSQKSVTSHDQKLQVQGRLLADTGSASLENPAHSRLGLPQPSALSARPPVVRSRQSIVEGTVCSKQWLKLADQLVQWGAEPPYEIEVDVLKLVAEAISKDRALILRKITEQVCHKSNVGMVCQLSRHHQKILAVLGVCLMRLYQRDAKWEQQFHVHHHLAVSQQFNYYSLAVTTGTKLEVALDAASVCLKLDRGVQANYVMEGSQWPVPSAGMHQEAELRELRLRVLRDLLDYNLSEMAQSKKHAAHLKVATKIFTSCAETWTEDKAVLRNESLLIDRNELSSRLLLSAAISPEVSDKVQILRDVFDTLHHHTDIRPSRDAWKSGAQFIYDQYPANKPTILATAVKAALKGADLDFYPPNLGTLPGRGSQIELCTLPDDVLYFLVVGQLDMIRKRINQFQENGCRASNPDYGIEILLQAQNTNQRAKNVIGEILSKKLNPPISWKFDDCYKLNTGDVRRYFQEQNFAEPVAPNKSATEETIPVPPLSTNPLGLGSVTSESSKDTCPPQAEQDSPDMPSVGEEHLSNHNADSGADSHSYGGDGGVYSNFPDYMMESEGRFHSIHQHNVPPPTPRDRNQQWDRLDDGLPPTPYSQMPLSGHVQPNHPQDGWLPRRAGPLHDQPIRPEQVPVPFQNDESSRIPQYGYTRPTQNFSENRIGRGQGTFMREGGHSGRGQGRGEHQYRPWLHQGPYQAGHGHHGPVSQQGTMHGSVRHSRTAYQTDPGRTWRGPPHPHPQQYSHPPSQGYLPSAGRMSYPPGHLRSRGQNRPYRGRTTPNAWM